MSSLFYRKNTCRQSGFTLLELLITIVIFSFISIGCYQLLKSVSQTQEIYSDLWQSLSEDVKVRAIVEKDFSQLISRPVRDQYGAQLPAFSAVQAQGTVEFTRRGWLNFRGENRSELQRVSYRLENGNWIRKYWYHLDRAPEADVIEQVLLADINSILFYFLDDNASWQQEWPPADVSKKETFSVLPRAIMVEISRLEDDEVVRWLFQGPENPTARSETDDEAEEDSDEEDGAVKKNKKQPQATQKSGHFARTDFR